MVYQKKRRSPLRIRSRVSAGGRKGRCILLPVPAVEKHSRLMATPSGNIAPTSVISETVSKAVMRMDKEQFRAERLYQISISVAKSMLEKGVISEKEFSEIDTILLKKYRPTLGTLLSGKPLT